MVWNLSMWHTALCVFKCLVSFFAVCCDKYYFCLLIIPAPSTGEIFILLFQLLYVSTVKCISCSYSLCSDYWNTVVYI